MSYTTDDREPDWSMLPEHMHGGVKRYIENGIPPGHFLTAIISNDLREACGRADDANRSRLFDYVKFFYCYAPRGCWGSPDNFQAWVKCRGLRGMTEQQKGTET